MFITGQARLAYENFVNEHLTSHYQSPLNAFLYVESDSIKTIASFATRAKGPGHFFLIGPGPGGLEMLPLEGDSTDHAT